MTNDNFAEAQKNKKRKRLLVVSVASETFAALGLPWLAQVFTIKNAQMALKAGDNAPDFKLYNTEKAEVSLGDYAGRNLVILFFPQSFTGVCTKELCNTRDDIAFYQNVGADVVAVSVDSIFTLGKFKEEQKLNFPLLSDFNKEMSTAYDSIYHDWILGMKGVSKRSAFVVDKNGIIRYAEVLESAGDLPNFDAVKATLQEIGN